MMKNLLFILLFCLTAAVAFGQQDRQNTQFMQYKLGYNPGYAGSYESACITALHRSQWLGLDGAPEATILTFNMPLFNQKVGIGLNLERFSLGLFEQYNMDGVYSYRIRLGQGSLGIGVQASVRSIEGNFQQSVAIEDPGLDESISMVQENKFLFNFGSGIYYHSPKFYFGISIPRFLKNNIDFAEEGNVISREVNHFYMMTGYSIDLGEKTRMRPQVLVRYVDNAPIDADANLNFIFNNRYIIGATYRLGGDQKNGVGESIDLLVSAQLTNNLTFGVSYDITLSELKEYSNGSIEVALQYCFGKSEGSEYVNPRFF